jgi:NADPH-dependent 2,4-dienoyl-CoA reductase/sulfur reductase-like enzyme
MSVSSTGRHHVVIVGCGVGGLSAAKALRRADVDVTVIDRTRHHLIQPLLCQVATGILSEGDIAPPIREILGHQRNTRVILGEVVDIDLDGRRVTVETTGQSKQISYDSFDRRRRREPVVLRAPRIRALRARRKDDRSRTGAARPDSRRL